MGATFCGWAGPSTPVQEVRIEEADGGDHMHAQTTLPTNVQGTFHQGDSIHDFPGFQCMAISSVALAKHTVQSAFTWQSTDLDQILITGDRVYGSLRDPVVGGTSEVLSLFDFPELSASSSERVPSSSEYGDVHGESGYLSIPDLPQQSTIEGKDFQFEFGDVVSGDVRVSSGPFIEAGVHTPLKDGLETVLSKYDRCFITLHDATSVIICEGTRYCNASVKHWR